MAMWKICSHLLTDEIKVITQDIVPLLIVLTKAHILPLYLYYWNLNGVFRAGPLGDCFVAGGGKIILP